MRPLRMAFLVLSSSILVPSLAVAQSSTTGSIAGLVRDTTGAVLPGVTVEAASPALIEKVRTVVTDDQGQYKILELRPGQYTVTFSLAGFATVKREGIELTTGFTAQVNAELRVGSLEETVTVSGASPVVDVQNVRTQNVLSRNALDTLPTGKTIQAWAALTLGAVTRSGRRNRPPPRRLHGRPDRSRAHREGLSLWDGQAGGHHDGGARPRSLSPHATIRATPPTWAAHARRSGTRARDLDCDCETLAARGSPACARVQR